MQHTLCDCVGRLAFSSHLSVRSVGRHVDTPEKAEARYAEFILAVVSNRNFWVLRNDQGFAVYRDDDYQVMPLWSNPVDAQQSAERNFEGYLPEKFEVANFTETVLPTLVERGIWLAPNPTQDLAGISLPAERLFQEVTATPN